MLLCAQTGTKEAGSIHAACLDCKQGVRGIPDTGHKVLSPAKWSGVVSGRQRANGRVLL